MKSHKKIKYTGLALVAVLILTNPNLSEFKGRGHQFATKKSNLFLCSVYESFNEISGYNETYVGVFGNFIKTDEYEKPGTVTVMQ